MIYLPLDSRRDQRRLRVISSQLHLSLHTVLASPSGGGGGGGGGGRHALRRSEGGRYLAIYLLIFWIMIMRVMLVRLIALFNRSMHSISLTRYLLLKQTLLETKTAYRPLPAPYPLDAYGASILMPSNTIQIQIKFI